MVGGPTSTPDGKGGKPRFPIIPAGAVVKSTNLPKAIRHDVAPNMSGIRSAVHQAANAPASASNNARVGSTVQENKAAKRGRGDAKSSLDKGNQVKKSKA